MGHVMPKSEAYGMGHGMPESKLWKRVNAHPRGGHTNPDRIGSKGTLWAFEVAAQVGQ